MSDGTTPLRRLLDWVPHVIRAMAVQSPFDDQVVVRPLADRLEEVNEGTNVPITLNMSHADGASLLNNLDRE